MNGPMDSAGVQTLPLVGTGAVAVAPLPSDQDLAKPVDTIEAVAVGERIAVATTTDTITDTPVASPITTATVAQPAAFAQPPTGAGMVGTTILTLVLVIGFILLLAWVAKRMPGIGGGSNPALKIVGSLPLGPRERVVVVAVGDTQLLLSTGPNGTRALHTLEQPLPVNSTAPSPFAQVLAQQFGKKKS